VLDKIQMATVFVREVEEDVYKGLKERARNSGMTLAPYLRVLFRDHVSGSIASSNRVTVRMTEPSTFVIGSSHNEIESD
jgi:hypothetical protein